MDWWGSKINVGRCVVNETMRGDFADYVPRTSEVRKAHTDTMMLAQFFGGCRTDLVVEK